MNVRVVEGDLPTLHDQCATMRLNIRAPLRTGKRLDDVPLGAQVAIIAPSKAWERGMRCNLQL